MDDKKNEMFDFLDAVRESGAVNMFGAGGLNTNMDSAGMKRETF